MSKVQWIKISTDILHNRKIQALRYEKNGNQIILLWFYLLVLAGQTNDQGKIYFTSTVPYDEEKLSKELSISKKIISEGLNYFINNEMLDKLENGYLSIDNWDEYQNAQRLEALRESNRERQKRYYELHKPNAQPNALPNIVANANTPLSNDIDKNRIDKIRKEEIRIEENRSESLINEQGKNEKDVSFYDKYTDKLIEVACITQDTASKYHSKIKEFFSKVSDDMFDRYIKSFVEKRIKDNQILQIIGAKNG